MTTRHPFWSDDFDMDLLRVLPEAPEILAPAAHVTLHVHGGTSHGRLNHPSVWDSERGFVAFFGTHAPPPKPESYYTTPVSCTWEEAVRDAWAHHYALTVDRRDVWDAGQWAERFRVLMYDLRGWERIDDRRRHRLLHSLETTLHRATHRLLAVVALGGALPEPAPAPAPIPRNADDDDEIPF